MDQSTPILLLSQSETAAQLDRRSLREAGFANARILTSGIAAARLLAGMDITEDQEMPALVVCSHKLSDMDGEQFCAIIRQHPALLAIPILLVLPNDSEAAQLKTLGCGASVLLGRPFSIATLKNILTNMLKARPADAKMRLAAQKADTRAFEAALANYGILLKAAREPQDYFKAGIHCLHDKRWNLAISSFEQALSTQRLKGDAELGLAAAYKGKGDKINCQTWLAKAADTFTQQKKWQKAKSTYGRLLALNPSARNPFVTESHRLIREQEYAGAAETMTQAIGLQPLARLEDKFAQLCFAAANPQALLIALESELEKNTLVDAAFMPNLRQKLLNFEAEKKERQRLQAIERKWQLSQKLSSSKNDAEKIDSAPVNNPRVSNKDNLKTQTITPFGEEGDSMDLPANEADAEDSSNQEDTPVLAPLSQGEATTNLFQGAPRFNEFLSVMKLTWKLARRNKKDM